MKAKPFATRHLHDAGENYFQHLFFTAKIALTLIASGLIIFIHGVLPFLFVHTTTGMVERLAQCLVARREKTHKVLH